MSAFKVTSYILYEFEIVFKTDFILLVVQSFFHFVGKLNLVSVQKDSFCNVAHTLLELDGLMSHSTFICCLDILKDKLLVETSQVTHDSLIHMERT